VAINRYQRLKGLITVGVNKERRAKNGEEGPLFPTLLGSTSTSGHAQHLALSARCLRVLTTHSVTPEVTDTSVHSNLLHSLNIATYSRNQHVDNTLSRLSRHDILLPIHEPVGNFELLRVVDDGDQFLNLFVGQCTRTTVNIYFCLLANNVRKSFANANNLGHSKHCLPLPLNVRVQHTQNVLKLRSHLKRLQGVRMKLKERDKREISGVVIYYVSA
jgi:hypothetical protein